MAVARVYSYGKVVSKDLNATRRQLFTVHSISLILSIPVNLIHIMIRWSYENEFPTTLIVWILFTDIAYAIHILVLKQFQMNWAVDVLRA